MSFVLLALPALWFGKNVVEEGAETAVNFAENAVKVLLLGGGLIIAIMLIQKKKGV